MRQVAERDNQIATQREQLEASAAAQAALEAQLVAAGTRIAELEETAVAAAGLAGVSPEVEEKLAEALGAAETLMLQVRRQCLWGREPGNLFDARGCWLSECACCKAMEHSRCFSCLSCMSANHPKHA